MTTKRAVPEGPLTPFEAFKAVVHAHGVEALAKELGMKPGTLYNKADADADSHHQPTLRDVMLVTRLTSDVRVLDALDEMFGRAAFDVADMHHKSDQALLELVTKLGQEHGEFHAALHRALVQRRFTSEELCRVRAEAFDIVSALMTLVARLEGLVDA